MTPVDSCPDTLHDGTVLDHFHCDHLRTSILKEIYSSYYAIGQSYSRLREDKINGSLKRWIELDQLKIAEWMHSILQSLSHGKDNHPNTQPYANSDFSPHAINDVQPNQIWTIGITWIPQDFFRSWSLGRNPSYEIAATLANVFSQYLINKKVTWSLVDPTRSFGIKKQSKESQKMASRFDRNSAERFIQNLPIENRRMKSLDAVIICDDFLATGMTLRAFSEKVRKLNPEIPIYGYALAFRPQGLERVLQRAQNRY